MPDIAIEKGGLIRIQLREPKWVDRIALLLGAVMIIAGIVDLVSEGFESWAGATPVVGYSLAWLGYIRLHQGVGEIELSDSGILIRCYSLGPFSQGVAVGHYCAGVIPWGNLVEVGVAKVQMTLCLGLRLGDPRTFLNSRDQFIDEQTTKSVALNKLSVGSFTRVAGNLLGGLSGYTKLPRANDEIALMEWNRENYGYHIVCAGRPQWFFGRPYKGGAKKIAEVIREQAEVHR
jgi:hypothetical protein